MVSRRGRNGPSKTEHTGVCIYKLYRNYMSKHDTNICCVQTVFNLRTLEAYFGTNTAKRIIRFALDGGKYKDINQAYLNLISFLF